MNDIENAVILSMMKNPQAFLEASAKLTLASFTDVHTQMIFERLIEMSNKGEPFDEPLLKSSLTETGRLYYDNHVKWCDADSEKYEIYVSKLIEGEKLESLQRLGGEISDAVQGGQTLEQVLSIAEDKILNIANETLGSEMRTLQEELVEFKARIIAGKESGITTTIKTMDDLTNGFLGGQLIIIAGRPGMGKSALAMQIAYYNSLHNKVPFGVFLLEMSNEELLERLVANISGIESWKLRNGKLSDTDWAKFDKFQEEFKDAPFMFDDVGSITITGLRAKAKRLKMRYPNLGGIVVDYMQLMDSASNKSRVEEVSEISRGLKILAKELKIPVIAVSQLSRKVEDRESKRPVLSDLRESGSIEQDADVVILMYSSDYYSTEQTNESLTELILAKQRNGPVGNVKTVFNKNYQRFVAV